MLLVSSQIPQDRDGRVPDGIEAQRRLSWGNLVAVLRAADMGVTNLVKVTAFLSDRRTRPPTLQCATRLSGTTAPR